MRCAGALPRGTLRGAMCRLLAMAALFVAGADASTSKKKGPAWQRLMCDACFTVMETMAKDVKFLNEAGKMWKPDDLKARIGMSCMDPSLLQGAMQETCADMIDQHSKEIAKEVALRWNENSEEFEEDIVPAEFCAKVGVCQDGHKSINQMMSEGTLKDKLMKEEKEEKERLAKKAKKVSVSV
mmetsp:Transcript_131676/g.380871  ORF Transcript_131676/g.380871 Transcript_131676/m.380871 type:complete len:183 (-) Transcript_131676:120-668(-)